MFQCLRKGVFTWTERAQVSFENITLIVNNPALAAFDPSLLTIVSTDACDYSLGAILTQIHADQSERTVAFAQIVNTLNN